MSGGSWKYTIGDYDNGTGKLYGTSSGFIEPYPNSKYYDLYTTADFLTACSGKACLGHGLSEVSGWNSDYSYFVTSTGPWFVRGGIYNSGVGAGIFAFSHYGSGGARGNDRSFRLVISNE